MRFTVSLCATLSSASLPRIGPEICRRVTRTKIVHFISFDFLSYDKMADEAESVSSPTNKPPAFVKKLETQNVLEGSRFEFVCRVRREPSVRVTWIKDGRSELPDRYRVTSEGDVQRLWCDCAVLSDAGRFVCVARNEFGERRSMNLLTVQKNILQLHQGGHSEVRSPSKLLETSREVFTVDERARCSSKDELIASRRPDRASPCATSRILTTEVKVCGDTKGSCMSHARMTLMPLPTVTHDGSADPGHPEVQTKTFSVNSITFSPVTKMSKSNLMLKKVNDHPISEAGLQDSVCENIFCFEATDEEPKERAGAEVKTDNDVHKNSGAVIESDVQEMPTEVILSIEASTNELEKQPELELHAGCTEEMARGNSIPLAKGSPFGEKVEPEVVVNDKVHWDPPMSKCKVELSPKNSDPGPPGKRSCKAPEVFHLQPDNVQVVRGSEVLLTATFDPSLIDLRVTWYKGTSEIVPDERIAVETTLSSSILRISDSQTRDSECYTVSIENEYGRDQLSSSVTVEDRPEPPFQQPAVSSVGHNSLVLSWYGPAFDGGSPLLGYKIEQLRLVDGLEKEDSDWMTVSEDCQHTTYQVGNLTQAMSYRFRISCRNKHGFSEPGIPTEVVMTSSPSPEGKAGASEEESPPRKVHIDPSRNFQDHYRLGEVIGRGKFGVVQECFDKVTGRKFASKVIRLKQQQADDFRQEVDIMNRLNHPRLLQLWDAFESRREAHLVMEYIEGRELLERITTDDYTLTEGECVNYVRQICQGIGYMHQQGILHLDLKLENVLCVTEEGKDIKIIDFGLSKIYDPGLELKVMFGTAEFVAPEVVNFDPVSPSSDMWSLGVIAYILLSGFSPFAGESEPETLSNVTRAQHDYEEGFDGISEKAKDFINSLLLKDPKKRMSSSECLKHEWLSSGEADRAGKRLSTAQHKKFLNRRRWQKTGNAFRALSRLKGELKLLQRPRGMSIDRKTLFSRLLNRRDSSMQDSVFNPSSPSSPSPSSSTRDDSQVRHVRSGSLGSLLDRQRSRSYEELFRKDKSSGQLTASKVPGFVAPSR